MSDKIEKICNLVDEANELIDPNPDIHELFTLYDHQFFSGVLSSRGCLVEWSKRMTRFLIYCFINKNIENNLSCAGICVMKRDGHCCVRLSEPLLKLRKRKDLIETLLVRSNPIKRSKLFTSAWNDPWISISHKRAEIYGQRRFVFRININQHFKFSKFRSWSGLPKPHESHQCHGGHFNKRLSQFSCRSPTLQTTLVALHRSMPIAGSVPWMGEKIDEQSTRTEWLLVETACRDLRW